MIKLTDATTRCMEEHYNVIGIESSLRGCVYFTDPDKSGLLIVRPDGIARIKGNEIKAFVREMVEIAEVWFNWREGGRKMNETAKLKSCPFCGGEACILTSKLPVVLLDTDGEIGIREMFHAECKICGARVRKCKNQMQAIAAWNKRAQDTEAKRRGTEQSPKPLTLDELMGMERDPVWIEDLEEPINSEWLVMREAWSDGAGSEFEFEGGEDTFYSEDYGKTWLAYRTKPEGSGE